MLYNSQLLEIIWPIKKSELKLFISIALIMLCVVFNFAMLRAVKDSLVIPNIGAEVISFLKLWLVLPSTILFTIIYIRLSNIFSYEVLFYLIITAFLIFFLLFAYVLYPNHSYYHPSKDKINNLIVMYPYLKWPLLLIGEWSFALMYVFSDLWSVITINLLFWQFTNYILNTEIAKRFYPIFGMIGNLGVIFSGKILLIFSNIAKNNIEKNTLMKSVIDLQCIKIIQFSILAIIVAGVVAMIIYRYVVCYISSFTILNGNLIKSPKETKTKLSFFESIKLIGKSRYIGSIVVLLFCYGLAINIVEGVWKSKIKILYPSTIDYIYFMGNFNIRMGVSCVLFTIIGSNILRKLSWYHASIFTPIVIAITGSIFFASIIFFNFFGNFGIDNNQVIYYVVMVGAIQNIFTKATKYSLFDTTKEMLYIPLSLELRTKGKAVVDLVGLKFGKSLGAFIQSFFFILYPMATFDSVIIYLMSIFIIIMLVWLLHIKVLNEEYKKFVN